MSRLLLASAIGLVVLAGGAKQMVHADREKNPKNDSQATARAVADQQNRIYTQGVARNGAPAIA